MTSITHEDICVVVDQLEARLVECGTGLLLGNGKTNGIGKALSERPSGDLDALGVVRLGVAWGGAVDGLRGKMLNVVQSMKESGCTHSERLQVIHRQLVASQVQEGILEHAGMAVAMEGLAKSYPSKISQQC
jgi:hypothetical protein